MCDGIDHSGVRVLARINMNVGRGWLSGKDISGILWTRFIAKSEIKVLNSQRPTLDPWWRTGPGLVETKQWVVVGYDGEVRVTAEEVIEFQTAKFDAKRFPLDLAVASLNVAQ